MSFAKKQIKEIKEVIKMAELWTKDQVLPESLICMGALQDIRRIVQQKKPGDKNAGS